MENEEEAQRNAKKRQTRVPERWLSPAEQSRVSMPPSICAINIFVVAFEGLFCPAERDSSGADPRNVQLTGYPAPGPLGVGARSPRSPNTTQRSPCHARIRLRAAGPIRRLDSPDSLRAGWVPLRWGRLRLHRRTVERAASPDSTPYPRLGPAFRPGSSTRQFPCTRGRGALRLPSRSVDG